MSANNSTISLTLTDSPNLVFLVQKEERKGKEKKRKNECTNPFGSAPKGEEGSTDAFRFFLFFGQRLHMLSDPRSD